MVTIKQILEFGGARNVVMGTLSPLNPVQFSGTGPSRGALGELAGCTARSALEATGRGGGRDGGGTNAAPLVKQLPPEPVTASKGMIVLSARVLDKQDVDELTKQWGSPPLLYSWAFDCVSSALGKAYTAVLMIRYLFPICTLRSHTSSSCQWKRTSFREGVE